MRGKRQMRFMTALDTTVVLRNGNVVLYSTMLIDGEESEESSLHPAEGPSDR